MIMISIISIPIITINNTFGFRSYVLNRLSKNYVYDDYNFYVTDDNVFFMRNKKGIYGPDIIYYELIDNNIYMIKKPDPLFEKTSNKKIDLNCSFIRHNMETHTGFTTVDLKEFVKLLPKDSAKKFEEEGMKYCSY